MSCPWRLPSLLGLGGVRTRPVNPPLTQLASGQGLHVSRRASEAFQKATTSLVVLAFFGRWHARRRVLLRRSRVPPAHRGRRTEGQQGPPARRRRRHHRRVGRQLHRAGLWPVRRQAVRRLRAALPQARRPGRARRARPSIRPTGETCRRRAGAVPNWRPSCTTRSCSTARPSATSTAAMARSSSRRPPTSRPAAGCPSTRTSSNVLCSDLECGAAVPRRRRIVGRSRRAVAGHDQQLRRHLQLRAAGLGQDCSLNSANPPRPAARAIRELKDAETYADGAHRPYIHLVDGGVSDNLGMRGVLDALELLEALHDKGRADTARPREEDHRLRRQFAVVAPTNWDESETPPGTIDILLKATGVPIDHYSYEAVEQLKDIAARWNEARESAGWPGAMQEGLADVCAAIHVAGGGDLSPSTCRLRSSPTTKERAYLNEQPTSFVLPRRGGRSPARRGGDDHPRRPGIPAASEGSWRDDRCPLRRPAPEMQPAPQNGFSWEKR